MSRLRELYKTEAVPALTKQFGYKNVMAAPRLEKINENMESRIEAMSFCEPRS